MKVAWRQHLRRARFALTIAVGVLLIGTAVAAGVVQLLVPLVAHYPDFVAQQLADRLHRPVRFASIRGEWQPSGPLLTVRDLTLGPGHPGGQSITLPQAALKFDFHAWLRPAHRWITLRVRDIELRVEYTSAGWHVAGFGSAAGASHAPLQSLPVDLDIANLRVDIVDEVAHHAWRVTAPRLRIVNVGNAVRFGGILAQAGSAGVLAVRGRVDPRTRDYDLYFAARDFDFAQALHGMDLHGYAVQGARGDLELWAGWRSGKLATVAARYALRDLAATGPEGRGLAEQELSGVAKATRRDGIWHVAWRGPGKPGTDIDRTGGIIASLGGTAGARVASVAARGVDLTGLLPVVAMIPQAPPALIAWIARARPRLTVDTAALVWREHGSYDAVVHFSGLRAAASGRIPGVALQQGTLRADTGGFSLALPPQPAAVALTGVFREPFTFLRLAGTVVGWREDGHWNVAGDGLRFDTGTLAGTARAKVVLRGAGHPPFLSAYVALDHARAVDAKLFWPHSMSLKLVHWLDAALVGGEITSGGALVRGDLGNWPFLRHDGRFEAAGILSGATFHFADGWPDAVDLDAAVDFIDNRMGVVATNARVRGVTATRAVGTILDLSHGVLGLQVQAGGTGAELLDFVRNTPVGADAAPVLEGLSMGGTGKAAVELSIPLDDAAKFRLGGKVELADADVSAPRWNVALQGLTGALVLKDHGFSGRDLATVFRGAPARFSLAVGSGVANPADIVEASLDTRASMQALAQGYPELDGLVAHAHGVAPFHIGVDVAAGGSGTPAAPVLNIRSSLAGIALDFPAPLGKPADTTLPLDVRVPIPTAGAGLTVTLGDLLRVRGRLPDPGAHTPLALGADFGTTAPAAVPARGLVVGGEAATLDVGGWIQLALAAGSGSSGLQLMGVDVTTAAASVFGTDLGALRFTYTTGTDADTIGIDGPAVAGTISLPATGMTSRGITANFARLHWPEPPPSKVPAPPSPPSPSSPVAPTAVPPLHVAVKDLRLGSARFGAVVLQSAPTAAGMHIARFDAHGADFTLKAHGDWNGTRADSHSHLIADITTNDFGNTLAAFGLSGLLAGGKDSEVHIDGTWAGSPAGFSLAWTTGTLDLKVGQGRILAVKPGFGRLLGLLSVNELPSRLTLHFGDVFKSGFGFDHAAAQFDLRDGSAYTTDLQIEAPAAQITMRGRTGFRARDYQLVVEVVPHVGGTLPVVGAVVGGPVGAAAGLVVQGLLGKGINKAAGSFYQVTGSWEKPKITTLAAMEVPALEHAPGASTPTAAGPAPATSSGQ